MKKPETSIIIRTFNEENFIEKCLSSIMSQKYKNFEIIIIDSESNDDTIKIARKFPVKIIKIKKSDFTFGKSINIGCKNSRGKYCVILSAHAIPINNKWLRNLISPLKKKKIAGVFGRQIPHQNCNPLDKRLIENHWKNPKKNNKFFFSNANSAIKKEVWEKIKFNEKIPATEDHNWVKRTVKKGYIISYSKEAAVFHSHNETLIKKFKRNYQEIIGIYKTYGKIKIFRYIAITPYYFIEDTKYILKNKYSLCWIFFSLINSGIIFLSAFLALFK